MYKKIIKAFQIILVKSWLLEKNVNITENNISHDEELREKWYRKRNRVNIVCHIE